MPIFTNHTYYFLSSPATKSFFSESVSFKKNSFKNFFCQIKSFLFEENYETIRLSEEEIHLIDEFLEEVIKLIDLPPGEISLKEINKKLKELEECQDFRIKHQFCFSQLTPREKEVLSKLALGMQNKEIAELLFISLDTVKHHRKLIKSKLSASSTADFIRYAQAFELI